MKKLLILSFSLVMAVGCGSEESSEDKGTEISEPAINLAEEKQQEQGDSKVSKKELLEGKVLTKRAKKRSVSINKEKFTTIEQELGLGSKVYNIAMREYGTIKSTVVVVGDVSKDELMSHYEAGAAVKIAENTYRISPKIETSVYEFYKGLLKFDELTTVELEIDYSGSSIPTADY